MIIPTRTKVHIYQDSSNVFTISFIHEDETPYDLESFDRVELVQYRYRNRFQQLNTITPDIDNNVITVTLTPSETEEMFERNCYSLECRMYSDQENFYVYVVLDIDFINVFNTTWEIHDNTIMVMDNGRTEVV